MMRSISTCVSSCVSAHMRTWWVGGGDVTTGLHTIMASAAQLEKPAPLLIHWDSSNSLKESDFQAKLESKDDEHKIHALEQIIAMLINGELGPKVFMQVIKFCLNSDNHTIKKLLLSFFELVDKRNKDGQFLPEMILAWYDRHLSIDAQHIPTLISIRSSLVVCCLLLVVMR